MHVCIDTSKLPCELRSVESAPRTTSYVVAPDNAVYDRTAVVPTLAAVALSEPIGAVRRQVVATL